MTDTTEPQREGGEFDSLPAETVRGLVAALEARWLAAEDAPTRGWGVC